MPSPDRSYTASRAGRNGPATHTGRKVIAFMSQVHFEPDLAADVFVLEPEPAAGR